MGTRTIERTRDSSSRSWAPCAWPQRAQACPPGSRDPSSSGRRRSSRTSSRRGARGGCRRWARWSLWARRLLGPGGDVEDAMQEVFLVAYRRLPEYRGDAKITTWLHEITFRVTQNQRRKLRLARWLRLTPALIEGSSDSQNPLRALE